jgi:hypothetical protein
LRYRARYSGGYSEISNIALITKNNKKQEQQRRRPPIQEFSTMRDMPTQTCQQTINHAQQYAAIE